jgi:succinoglycan biosynthesis transport protein ExoP
MFHSTATARAVPTLPAAPTLRHLLAMGWSTRWWALGGSVLGLGAALALTQVLTPSYSAIAQLFIDPQNLQLLERDLSPNTAAGDAGVVLIESQARVMASDAVLRTAAEALDLVHDPEFVGRGNPLKAWLDSLSGADLPADDLGRAVLALGKAVHIVRLDRTYVVNVHAESEVAAKSAAIANAVVDAYLALRESQRTEQATRASGALEGRLSQLLEQLQMAENAVEAFKAQRGIVETAGQSLLDGEVSQANAAKVSADNAVEALAIQLDQLRALAADPERLAAAPEIAGSTDMARLRTDLQTALAEAAVLQASLGARHPSLLAAQERVASARDAIAAEIDRLVVTTELALDRARGQAASLTTRYDSVAAQLQATDQDRIRLRQLQREADASRAVYEDALLRSRETAEQAQIDTLNAQVVSRATPPVEASFPPRPAMLLTLGLLGGLLAGMAIGLLRKVA